MSKVNAIDNSKRKYSVVAQEGSTISVLENISLNQICTTDGSVKGEVYCAMYEIIDTILDLKLGESIFFVPNRDIHEYKGIIVRLQ